VRVEQLFVIPFIVVPATSLTVLGEFISLLTVANCSGIVRKGKRK